MKQPVVVIVPRRRTLGSVFHDYVRGVFADQSVRRRAVFEKRSEWLHGFAHRPNGR